MPNSRDFIEHVLELLRPGGGVAARAMFGGHGLYVDGMIIGLVVDDVLYFKTDDASRARFSERALEPFVFRKRKTGESVATGYYRPPEEALDSPDAMREWQRLAMGAALRAASRRAPRKARSAATSRAKTKRAR